MILEVFHKSLHETSASSRGPGARTEQMNKDRALAHIKDGHGEHFLTVYFQEEVFGCL
jgi:hypothetical protein